MNKFFYCPVCGEKNTIENINGKMVCFNCKNDLEGKVLLDNVDDAYKVWLNYQYLKVNGFIKEKIIGNKKQKGNH